MSLITKQTPAIKKIFSVLCTRKYSDIVDPPDDPTIKIPEYVDRPNEPLETRRARLIYQSRKRGMLENDLILSTFASKYLKNMNEQQVIEYDMIINKPSNDWEIYHWATGTEEVPAEYDNSVMTMIKDHVKNSRVEPLNEMPSLY